MKHGEGGTSGVVLPDPIPNSEVKHAWADDTLVFTSRKVGGCPFIKDPTKSVGSFFVWLHPPKGVLCWSGGGIPSASKRRKWMLPIVRPAPVMEIKKSERAYKVARFCTDPLWIVEEKHDGYRCLAQYDGTVLQLLSKSGKPHRIPLNFYRILERYFPKFGITSIILDSELMGFDADGREDFFSITKVGRSRKLYAFDLLYLNGEDYSAEPLNRRKLRLQAFVEILHQAHEERLVLHVPGVSGQEEKIAMASRTDKDWEGVVFKHTDSVYGDKTLPWYKFKNEKYGRYPKRAMYFKASRL